MSRVIGLKTGNHSGAIADMTAAALEGSEPIVDPGRLDRPVKTVRPGKRRPLPRPETYTRQGRKTGRNEPCPCGSGQKYKRCHLPIHQEERTIPPEAIRRRRR